MFRMISLLALVLAVSACASRPPVTEHVTGQEVPSLELSEREYEWDEDKSTALNFAHLGQAEGAFRDWDTPDGGQREVSSGGSFLRSAAMFWSTGGSVGMTAADQAATSSQARRYEEDPFGIILVPTDELAAHQQEYDDGGFRLVYDIVAREFESILGSYVPDMDVSVHMWNQEILDYMSAYSPNASEAHIEVVTSGATCDKAKSDEGVRTLSRGGIFSELGLAMRSAQASPEGKEGDCIMRLPLMSLGEVSLPGVDGTQHAFHIHQPSGGLYWLREMEAYAENISWVIPNRWRVSRVRAASKVPYVRHGDSRYFFTHDDSSEPVEDGLSPYILYDNDPQFQEEG